MHQGVISHVIQNNIDIINKYHNRHHGLGKDKADLFISRNKLKWFSFSYGKDFHTKMFCYVLEHIYWI